MVQEPDFLQEKPKNEEKPFLSPATIVLIAGLVLFVIIMGIALFRQNQTQPIVGEIAPSFQITSYDGQVYRSEDLRGKIVIINMWANWCAPCHVEAPALEQIHREYADDGVVLLGVNWLDVESEAMSFINRYELSYPNGPDTGELIYNAFHIQGMPETFVIGRDGRIVGVFIGGLTFESLSAVLDKALTEGV